MHRTAATLDHQHRAERQRPVCGCHCGAVEGCTARTVGQLHQRHHGAGRPGGHHGPRGRVAGLPRPSTGAMRRCGSPFGSMIVTPCYCSSASDGSQGRSAGPSAPPGGSSRTVLRIECPPRRYGIPSVCTLGQWSLGQCPENGTRRKITLDDLVASMVVFQEASMKLFSAQKAFLTAVVFTFGMLGSVEWSKSDDPSEKLIKGDFTLATSIVSAAETGTLARRASCTLVRFYVARYSAPVAEAWARSKGATDADIQTARRCISPQQTAQYGHAF